ncbi:MAG: GntR family transcriptional regulator [Pseudomonadota bacterium]
MTPWTPTAPEDEAATAHERVYRRLRGAILAGTLAPGQALTLRGLAADMDTSMTPAREAVRRLAAERALALTPSGRITVPLPDAARLDELFEARRLLEPALARRAALAAARARTARALAEVLAAHDDALAQAVEAGDGAGYVAANAAFHGTLYRVAEAPALMALVESIWLQSTPVMRRVYGVVGTRALEDHHAAAIAALRRDDAEALADAIERDVAQGAALAAEAALDPDSL